MSAKGIVVQSMPKNWTNWSRINDELEEKEKQERTFNNSILIEQRPYFMRYLYPNYTLLPAQLCTLQLATCTTSPRRSTSTSSALARPTTRSCNLTPFF